MGLAAATIGPVFVDLEYGSNGSTRLRGVRWKIGFGIDRTPHDDSFRSVSGLSGTPVENNTRGD